MTNAVTLPEPEDGVLIIGVDQYRDEFMPLLRRRVSNGASFLDNHLVRWFDKIDTSQLDIADGYFCVIGQLYGDYRYVEKLYDAEKDMLFPEEHGFYVSNLWCIDARNLWISEIESRKSAL